MAKPAVPTRFHETIRQLCAVTRSRRGKAAISAAGGLGLRTALASVLADFPDSTLIVSTSPVDRSSHPLTLVEVALEGAVLHQAAFELVMQEPRRSKGAQMSRLTRTRNWARAHADEQHPNKLLIISFCQFLTQADVDALLHVYDDTLGDEAPGLILTGNRSFLLPADWTRAEGGNKVEGGKSGHLGADYCDLFDFVETIDYQDVMPEDIAMIARHLGSTDEEMDVVQRSVANGAKPTYRQIKREIARIRARSKTRQDAGAPS